MSGFLAAGRSAHDAEGDPGRQSPGCDVSSAEERIRSRELAQYFTAAAITPGKKDADGVGKSDDRDTPPRLASDPTLTALAQLGALKLQAARSFISIIDRTHQYVITEATRSVSLRDATVHEEGDGLFMGVRALDLVYGVCAGTMHVFLNCPPGELAIDTDVILASREFYMIRDFTKHHELNERPYVTGEPHMRSYLEVPLSSDQGLVIGSYCVVDDHPRSFDQAQINVLTEIAGTIMQHLDLLKSREELRRSRALVRGLGMYVDGYSSLHEHQSALGQEISSPCSSNGDGAPRHGVKDNARSAQATLTPPSEAVVEVIPRPEMKGPRRVSEYGNHVSQEIREAFSRASNLILQSMEADGVAFLDAVGFDHNAAQSDINSMRQCPILSHTVHTNDQAAVQAPTIFNIGEDLLRRLLVTYPVGHVLSCDEFGVVPGGTINRDARLANHPSRRAFRNKNLTGPSEESHDMAALLAGIPGASSVLFLPLWSFRKERWYAATVCWSTDRTRFFGAEDLHYLSAFGNSVMAEVARAEAVAVSSAKSDFISSISHELKSPLHGILAGVDLLREASGPSLDSSSLSAISSCGMMLLDTVNHLLDFAKINFLSTSSTSAGKKGSVVTTKLVNINLATVVQDVVEGLHLAYSKRHLYGEDPHTNTIGISPPPIHNLSPGCTPVGKSPEDVIILVDIDPKMKWNFKSEIGAWKRCTMNILGNALKFTETGQIIIRLSVADLPVQRFWGSAVDNQKHVRLDIQDTGRGMSKEFVAGGLFTPFVQENALSVGTGLGLSIVQQLAKGLGGRVEVDSEPGMGTKFSVLVPFGDACSPLLNEGDMCMTSLDPEGILRGRRIYIPPVQSGDDEPVSRRTESVRQLLLGITSEWLGMTASAADPHQPSDGDLIVRQVVGPQGGLDHSWTVERVDLRQRKPQHTSPMFPHTEAPLTHPFGPRTVATALLGAMHPRPALEHMTALANSSSKKRTSSSEYPDHPAKLRKLSICAPQPSSNGDSKQHLLLVDDNKVNLRILAMTVTKVDCTVVTASDGQEAVEAVVNNLNTPGNHHFDWIFMDMSMPVMDGATATRKIRSFEKNAGVLRPAKIIALTALSGEGAENDAVSSGCDMFLSKPVSINKVRQLLREGRADADQR